MFKTLFQGLFSTVTSGVNVLISGEQTSISLVTLQLYGNICEVNRLCLLMPRVLLDIVCFDKLVKTGLSLLSLGCFELNWIDPSILFYLSENLFNC